MYTNTCACTRPHTQTHAETHTRPHGDIRRVNGVTRARPTWGRGRGHDNNGGWSKGTRRLWAAAPLPSTRHAQVERLVPAPTTASSCGHERELGPLTWHPHVSLEKCLCLSPSVSLSLRLSPHGCRKEDRGTSCLPGRRTLLTRTHPASPDWISNSRPPEWGPAV